MADGTDEAIKPDGEAVATAATGGETASGTATESASGDTGVVAAAPTADVVRPNELPETLWDATAKAPKWADLAARITRADELEAAETERKAGLPEKADAYLFKPSGEPIKLSDGTEAAIDPANPLAKAVAEVAHKNGLPQAAVSDLARAFIETSMADNAAIDRVISEERAKLGEKATERVTAAEAFLRAQGANDDQLGMLRGFPALVPLFETLQSKLTGATVTTAQGQGAAKTAAEVWFPSMKKSA